MASDVKIDIGEDGGELTVVQSNPPVYMINDRVVNEAAAYAWIFHWHTVRDAAIPTDPPGGFRCQCEPCTITRETHL